MSATAIARRRVFGASLLILLAGLVLPLPSDARQAALDRWRIVYPSSTSDDNLPSAEGGACAICHNGANTSQLNAYGNDIRRVFQSLPGYPALTLEQREQAIRAVERLNSDNDVGRLSNVDEILLNSQPGWNATGKNRIYGAASGDPVDAESAFPRWAPNGISGFLDPPIADSTILRGIADLGAGSRHTCGLTLGGGVKCWGDNRLGQLGEGFAPPGPGFAPEQRSPIDVTALPSGVSKIAVGGDHACALTAAGGVKCWGWNDYGQLGDGTKTLRPIPTGVVGLASGVKAIAAGPNTTCALTAAGGVKCWGYNGFGGLGNNSQVDSATPVDVVGLASGVKAIAVGYTHTCALTDAGGVKCWGGGGVGQLGDGLGINQPIPVSVQGLASGVAAITAGAAHTCALLEQGTVRCWGNNLDGQLGDGTTDARLLPTSVAGLGSPVKSVSAGSNHTCAATIDGIVRCWGSNSFGELGDNTTTSRLQPVPVSFSQLMQPVSSVAAGTSHSCALTNAGTVFCWGSNLSGQLGNGSDYNYASPVNSRLAYVVGLAAGEYHTCRAWGSGGVQCWGDNSSGQLGDGTFIDRLKAVETRSWTIGAVRVAAGAFHSCVINAAGGVECWGSNNVGQLGDGTASQRSTPVNVVGLESGVKSLTAGSYHTCALTVDGAVRCWGWNDQGQLGNGTKTTSLVPQPVSGLAGGVASIESGAFHTCAVLAGGGVRCWGWNQYGQVGDGSVVDKLTPVSVTSLAAGVASVSVGVFHSCAHMEAGGVKCWGDNFWGELGDGTTTQRLAPVDVNGLSSGVVRFAAGHRHNCAIVAGGAVKCWGDNATGQLGDGTTTPRSVPTTVVGVAGALAVTGGYGHTCVYDAQYQLKCWGRNGDGELGDGTTIQRNTAGPVQWLSATSTSLGALPSPSTVGQVVVLTATVTGAVADGTVAFLDGGLTIAGCGTRPLAAGRATCSTATLAAGVHAISAVYSGNASVLAASISNTVTHTVVAAFALSVTQGPGGTVSVSPDQSGFVGGTVVTLTAVPAPGYAFSYWSGDAIGPANPIQLVMDGDREVRATFTATDTCAGFADVSAGSAFCGNVQWLRNRAVTLGCSSTTAYCPNDAVSRLAMAAFLNRLGTALGGPVADAQARSGGVDPAVTPIVCATSAIAAAPYPRRVQLDAVMSAVAVGDRTVIMSAVVSLDDGATWQTVADAQAMSYLQYWWNNLRVLGHHELNAGQAARFGLRLSHAPNGTPGPLLDSWCHLRARVDNRTDAQPPLDP